MQHRIRRILLGLVLGLMLAGQASLNPRAGDIAVPKPPEMATDARHFIHIVNAKNRLSNKVSVISHPLTNDNPGALIYVSQNLNPAGAATKPVFTGQAAVEYNVALGRWTLVAIGVNFANGHSFTVQVAAADDYHYVHGDANPGGAATELDHPLLNNNPDAVVMVTPQRWGGILNNHRVALDYNEGTGLWSIVNQDGEPMPDDVRFNIKMASDRDEGGKVQVEDDPKFKIGPDSAVINDPSLNHNPYALFLYTAQANIDEPEMDYPYAAAYYAPSGRWRITRQDGGEMEGAIFHIHMPEPYEIFGPQLIQNRGFETAGATNKHASKWQAARLNLSMRSCNNPLKNKFTSAAGNCAFQFKGFAGGNTLIKQVRDFATPLPAEQVFLLSAQASAVNVTAGAKVEAVLVLTDNSKVKLTLPSAALNAGTYTYKHVRISSDVLPLGVKQIIVRASMAKAANGTFRLDEVSLTYQKPQVNIALPNADGQAATDGRIPLPPAP